ncbi:MAG: glutathione S-transferase N-terminal domain-containing protein [Hyphomicrobiales bacterium]|uniref:glutathione S-transferase n=1 Tax=Nisaea sp. TaxID=2024842 RepID=UPI003276BBFD
MMILRSSPPSPFGRQVKLAAKHLGLMEQISVEVADTTNPEDTLRGQNPLGKIPVLIAEEGMALYDSRVILDYLDHLAGGEKIVPAGEAKFAAYTTQSLANGIADAALIQVYEKRFRPEELQSKDWMDYQADKVRRGMASFEACPPPLTSAKELHVGHIALSCALGYQDLRFEGAWRKNYPHLVAWLENFSALVPGFEETKIST